MHAALVHMTDMVSSTPAGDTLEGLLVRRMPMVHTPAMSGGAREAEGAPAAWTLR